MLIELKFGSSTGGSTKGERVVIGRTSRFCNEGLPFSA